MNESGQNPSTASDEYHRQSEQRWADHDARQARQPRADLFTRQDLTWLQNAKVSLNRNPHNPLP